MKIFPLSLTAALVLLGGLAPPARAAEPTEPTEKDKKQVAEVARRLLKEMKPVPDLLWPPEIKVISGKRPREKYKMEYNAFASARPEDAKWRPYIRITASYLEDMHGNVDILALTLGHELGHIHHRHMFKSAEGKPELVQLAFSRTKEYEADAFGAKLMRKAGFSVIRAVQGKMHMKAYAGNHVPLDALRITHPAWDDRFARIVQDPQVWEALATFHNGAALLAAEQFFAAERCFESVTKFDRACYEAWVNLGHARLMQYCDKLAAEDLKDMRIGQVLCGAFYRRAKSLEAKVRGKDEKLWFRARDALNRALELKPDLALAKANLGLAYLVHPNGKEVAEALTLLRQAQEGVAGDTTLPTLDRAALQINLGVALLAEGSRKDGLKQLTQARDLLKKANWWQATLPGSAIRYNEAMALADAPARNDKDRAVKLFEEYLRQSDSLSAWWSLAYDRYTEVCKLLKQKPLDRKSLQQSFNTRFRMLTTLSLEGGLTVTLAEKTEDVLKRLGKPKAVLEVLKGSLKRYRFEKYPLELLAGDRIIAIILRSRKAPVVTLKPRTLSGGKTVKLHVGLSRKELLETMPGSRMPVGRNLLEAGEDNLYDYYRELGLAIRYDEDYPNGHVTELILVQIPEPREKEHSSGG